MIDEHEYTQNRRRFLGETAKDVRAVLAVISLVVVVVLQIIELALIFSGRH